MFLHISNIFCIYQGQQCYYTNNYLFIIINISLWTSLVFFYLSQIHIDFIKWVLIFNCNQCYHQSLKHKYKDHILIEQHNNLFDVFIDLTVSIDFNIFICSYIIRLIIICLHLIILLICFHFLYLACLWFFFRVFRTFLWNIILFNQCIPFCNILFMCQYFIMWYLCFVLFIQNYNRIISHCYQISIINY